MPDGLEVTAKTWEDEIMGVRARRGAAALEGVQFHPESIMTAVGKQLLANFLRMAREPRPAAAQMVAP
jgi:anthranilate/para-aminobenzoate synthase component II